MAGDVIHRLDGIRVPELPRLTDLGVLYPALLFTLPNSLKIPALSAAPETLLLFALFPVMLLSGNTLAAERSGRYASNLQIAALAILFGGLAFWAARGAPSDLVRIGIWLTTFLFGIKLASSPRRVLLLWFTWTAVATTAALVLLLDPSRWGEKVVNIFAWEHRTTYAYFLAVPTVVLLVRLLAPTTLSGLLGSAPLLVLLPAIYITQSRGAWLVVAIGVGLLLFLDGHKRRAAVYGACGTVAITVAVWTMDTEVGLLVRSIFDWNIRSSALYRFDLYFAGMSAITETGLWGSGPSSVGGVLGQYTLQQYGTLDDDKFATDSDVIWLLVEAGAISALALICCLVCFAKQLARRPAIAAPAVSYRFVSSIYLAFVALIVFDNVLMSPLGWFLMGTIWGGFRLLSATSAAGYFHGR